MAFVGLFSTKKDRKLQRAKAIKYQGQYNLLVESDLLGALRQSFSRTDCGLFRVCSGFRYNFVPWKCILAGVGVQIYFVEYYDPGDFSDASNRAK